MHFRHQNTNHLYCKECNTMVSRRHECFGVSVDSKRRFPEPLSLENSCTVKAHISQSGRPGTVFVPISIGTEWVEAACMVMAAKRFGGGSLTRLSQYALVVVTDGCLACRSPQIPKDFHSCQDVVDMFLDNNFLNLCHMFCVEASTEARDQTRAFLMSRTYAGNVVLDG